MCGQDDFANLATIDCLRTYEAGIKVVIKREKVG